MGDGIQRKARLHPRARGRAPSRTRARRQRFDQPLGQSAGVLGRNEPPVNAVIQHLRGATHAGGHRGQRTRHALQERHRQPLGPRGQGEDIARAQPRRHIGDRAHRTHGGPQPELRHAPPEGRLLGPISQQNQRGLGARAHEQRPSLQQHIHPLFGCQAPGVGDHGPAWQPQRVAQRLALLGSCGTEGVQIHAIGDAPDAVLSNARAPQLFPDGLADADEGIRPPARRIEAPAAREPVGVSQILNVSLGTAGMWVDDQGNPERLACQQSNAGGREHLVCVHHIQFVTPGDQHPQAVGQIGRGGHLAAGIPLPQAQHLDALHELPAGQPLVMAGEHHHLRAVCHEPLRQPQGVCLDSSHGRRKHSGQHRDSQPHASSRAAQAGHWVQNRQQPSDCSAITSVSRGLLRQSNTPRGLDGVPGRRGALASEVHATMTAWTSGSGWWSSPIRFTWEAERCSSWN
ncbi:conserved hypothetical protein [Stigmatella aurantiaca DW4/3-1]|uniref:Uncharacterized protein n=1 Tax=Stigmatella aurantiaca (strain DW4/3-1) TaxID=378806 RepID=Q097R8_STIAD|nr:conserved hypothetical protein [Stigmatella aurantiaca DW4/3-1]